MDTIKVDVDMNNLPEYVRDVFEEMRDSVFDYRLLHISHSLLKEGEKIDTEFWEMAFQENVMQWITFISLHYQPWNQIRLYRDNVIVPIRTLKEIMGKVEE